MVCKFEGLGLGFKSIGFRVQDFGFSGFGFRIQGLMV